MLVEEILDTVQFVVDQEGKPQAAMLNMKAWMALLTLLEEIEDRQLIRTRLVGWRTKDGWSDWDNFDNELDEDVIQTVG